MKIYHRKNFLMGLGETLLGLLNLLLAFLNGFELSNLVIGLACLFFGVGTILRACSRKYAIEDKLEELDERNQLVQLKSLSKSFQLTRWISFAMMLAFLVMGKLSGEMSFIGMAVGIALVFPVSLFVEMGTFLYYESKE